MLSEKNRDLLLEEKVFAEMRYRAEGYAEIAKISRRFFNEFSKLRQEFHKKVEEEIITLGNSGGKITPEKKWDMEQRIWKRDGYSTRIKELENKSTKLIRNIVKERHISLHRFNLLTE